MSASVEVRNVSAGYGQASVLRDVSITVDPGETISVVGANGAGKSTLLSVIAGLLEPTSGAVIFNGEDITGLPSHKRPAIGMVMVPEGGRLFPFMTVEENLQLGGFSNPDRAAMARRIDEMTTLFPVLGERRHQLAGHLSGGERQMCAIARAVMSRPKLLMLDEPSVGLSPMMVEKVFELVQALGRSEGLSIILVEQNVEEALEVSARSYVIDHGQIVRSGRSAELKSDPSIQAAYMGL